MPERCEHGRKNKHAQQASDTNARQARVIGRQKLKKIRFSIDKKKKKGGEQTGNGSGRGEKRSKGRKKEAKKGAKAEGQQNDAAAPKVWDLMRGNMRRGQIR